MAFQLGVSAKQIRGWLRTVYPRPDEQKNEPWFLDAEQVVGLVRKFGP